VLLRGVHRDEGLEVAVGWLAPATGDAAFAAHGFAAVARESLERGDGIRARWAHGGAFGGRAFAMVGITVSPDALDSLPARLRRALESVRWTEVATQIRAQREETLAWRGGTPRSLSRSLLSEADTPAEAEIASMLRRMAASEPAVVVARPQPGRR